VQAILFEVPRNPDAWQRFSWSHRQSHALIRAAIQARGGPNLPDYVLDVSEEDFGGFLERNALSHLDMNAAIGAQGSDLEELDPTDDHQLTSWTYLHAQEHRTAEDVLGITS
jgi:hypothetical protein